MEVRCDKCQARYRVDDARIGPQGLTMRCGKCQNTFKVTKASGDAAKPAPAAKPATPAPATPAPADEAAGATMMFQVKPAAPAPAAAKPAAPAPAAAPADDAAGATMMFNVAKAPAAPAAKPAAAPPAAAKPAAPAPKPAAAPAAAPADESAGRTMMFNTGNLKSATSPGVKTPLKAEEGVPTIVSTSNPATPAPAKMPPPSADADAGSTMVFGQSPIAAQALTAKPPAAVSKPAATDDAAGSTMMFGSAPVSSTHTPATAVRPPKTDPGLAVPKAAEAAPAEEEEAPPAEEPEAAASEEEAPAEPPEEEEAAGPETTQETSPDEYRKEAGIEAEGMEAAPEEESAFDKEPPKGIIIGVIAGVLVVAAALVGLLMWKKMGAHPPPQAVLEEMAAAQTDADKDTIATLTSAESKAKQALDDAGPKAKYPEGIAQYARIEIQLADALADQAQIFSDKSGRETDAAKKADDDAQVTSLAGQADAKLKHAYEVLTPSLKLSPDSPDVLLAFADYYRAKHASSNMNKFLKAAQSKHADDARVAFIQGMAAEQEDDGAERAIPKLKSALQGTPASARIHYRLAVAYQAMKDEANARSEYNETLKISPSHERAKAALDAMGAGK